eukprot:SAG31_NODE_873_length_11325_cov_34.061197_2_plen_82_part_00
MGAVHGGAQSGGSCRSERAQRFKPDIEGEGLERVVGDAVPPLSLYGSTCRPIACLLERRGLASLGVAERTHRAENKRKGSC